MLSSSAVEIITCITISLFASLIIALFVVCRAVTPRYLLDTALRSLQSELNQHIIAIAKGMREMLGETEGFISIKRCNTTLQVKSCCKSCFVGVGTKASGEKWRIMRCALWMFTGHFYKASVAAFGKNMLFTFLFILSKLAPFTGHVALSPASFSLVRRKDVFVRLEVMQETKASRNT